MNKKEITNSQSDEEEETFTEEETKEIKRIATISVICVANDFADLLLAMSASLNIASNI